MKNQVLSIEQMKRLKELGVDTSKASMFYVPKLEPKGAYCLLNVKPTPIIPFVPAFTFHDIIDLLPKEIKTSTDTYWLTISIYDCKEWYVCYSMSDEFDYYKEFKSKSLLDEAYGMMCCCAENGYLNNNQTK